MQELRFLHAFLYLEIVCHRHLYPITSLNSLHFPLKKNKKTSFYCLYHILSLLLQSVITGVLIDSAEIIPIEPDAGNAAAGIDDITFL